MCSTKQFPLRLPKVGISAFAKLSSTTLDLMNLIMVWAVLIAVVCQLSTRGGLTEAAYRRGPYEHRGDDTFAPLPAKIFKDMLPADHGDTTQTDR